MLNVRCANENQQCRRQTNGCESTDNLKPPQLRSNSLFFPIPQTSPITTRPSALPSEIKLRPSITDISSGRCPLLHLLPWLDTSCAAVIGPRSYGLCWWSQRVRKAGGRVVPVHHPVKDSLPRRSFVEQRTHIVAAWVRPTDPSRQSRHSSPQSAKAPCSYAISRVKVCLLPSEFFRYFLFMSRHGEPGRLCMVSPTHVSLFPRMHCRLWLEVLQFSFLPHQTFSVTPTWMVLEIIRHFKNKIYKTFLQHNVKEPQYPSAKDVPRRFYCKKINKFLYFYQQSH